LCARSRSLLFREGLVKRDTRTSTRRGQLLGVPLTHVTPPTIHSFGWGKKIKSNQKMLRLSPADVGMRTGKHAATTSAAAAGPPLVLPPPAASLPLLLRAVVCRDGSLKANFRDNTVLLLDPTGAAFTVHTPGGARVRQLSAFAVSRFAEYLRVALEFRNGHVDVPFCPPVVTKRFSSRDAAAANDADAAADAAHTRVFRCEKRIAVTRWSTSVGEARRSGLFTRLDGGGAALESMDRVARVVLSAHGLVAHVTYPLLYAKHQLATRDDATAVSYRSSSAAAAASRGGGGGGDRGGAVDDGEGTKADGAGASASHVFDYVWHTQTFSADACPARWAYPVALLTEVVYAGAGGHAASAPAAPAETETDAETERQVGINNGDGGGDGDGDGDGESPPEEPTTPTTPTRVEAAAAAAGGDEAAFESSSSSSPSSGSATTLPVSSTASSPAPAPALWLDDSPGADPHAWWSSASLLGYPPTACNGGAVSGGGGGGGGGGAVGSSRRRWSVAVEHVPGMVQWTVRGGQSRGSARRGLAALETAAGGVETVRRLRGDCSSPGGAGVETVAALDDGSALVSTAGGRYVLHVPDQPGAAALAQLYRADAVPDRVGGVGAAAAVFATAGLDGGVGGIDDDNNSSDNNVGDADAADAAERVPIGRFAARLFALRTAAAADTAKEGGEEEEEEDAEGERSAGSYRVRGTLPPNPAYISSYGGGGGVTPAAAALWAVESADAVEESTGEGAGKFTAFADGRVRVVFGDRTMLELSRCGSAARLLMPDGERVEVGTCPKFHAQMLVKVPKTPHEYPKSHAQMLVKVPKMSPKYPKCCFRWRHNQPVPAPWCARRRPCGGRPTWPPR
jgi:hypothetical protein